ncbi:hypothetical protein [Treponema sp.]|uniref:hypothetical protein n=1 Tax=Treponema sp. TaxID=166 RepID=UPI00388F91A2
MDNDNKIENTSENIIVGAEAATKPRRPRKSAEQKAKESILAAAEEVIVNGSRSDSNSTAVVSYGHSQELVHNQVAVLLESELTRISNEDMRKSFDMDEEYAKAKKNSLRFAWTNMWSRLFLCVLVVLAITVVLSIIVNISNKRIPVNVKGFDNANLTELLDDVDKIESQIKAEEEKKSEYEKKRSEEIQKVEDAYIAEKEKIEKVFEQEKKKAERNYSADKKKLESKETKGWMEGRTKNKDIEQNEKKYEQALAAAKKKRADALAISKNKYRNDLAQAKNLYKTEIDTCLGNISKFREDRYRFDNNKVQLEAEYDGKLKDKDIQHKREMDDQKTDYENRLAAAQKTLEETIAADLARENKRVEDTINSYDPALLKDNRTKKIVKAAGAVEYNVGSEDRISYLPKEGSSEIFKKSLESQKAYYDDLSYLASSYEQFPHKENRAVVTYAKALKSLANKAGNEIYASSVNEVNRLLDEKKRLEYEKNTALTQKSKLQEEYDNLIEVLCSEMIDGRSVSAVVTTGSGLGYNIYVSKSKISTFTSDAHKGFVFPCTVYRDAKKIAGAYVERTKDGTFVLVNIALSGSGMVRTGDRIVLEEPHLP